MERRPGRPSLSAAGRRQLGGGAARAGLVSAATARAMIHNNNYTGDNRYSWTPIFIRDCENFVYIRAQL